MKRIIFSSLLISILATSACTRGEFLFRFADDYAAAKVDKYFDLTSEQKKELKTEIRKDIDASKKEVLPKMAQHLRQLEKDMNHEAKAPEAFTSAVSDIQQEIKSIPVYFEQTAINASLKLSEDQVQHFASEVREEIQEKEEDPEEIVEKVEKRYRKSIEYFVGNLTRDQNKMIQDFLTKNPYPWKLQNLSQEHMVQQFVAAASKSATRKAFVEKFAQDYESVRLPEYTKALAEHQKAFVHFLANDFWASLTQDQKTELKENLIARAEQLERIAKQ